MAIDTPEKRASVLIAGSFFPGRFGISPTPDGSGADDNAERSFFGYRYSGIAADVPVVVVETPRQRTRRGVGQ